MKEDFRDERLATIIDRAIRGMEPAGEDRLPSIVRKGKRRRAVR
jgi:hypothetical protein